MVQSIKMVVFLFSLGVGLPCAVILLNKIYLILAKEVGVFDARVHLFLLLFSFGLVCSFMTAWATKMVASSFDPLMERTPTTLWAYVGSITMFCVGMYKLSSFK